jgi:hypothetical protein
MQKWDYLQVDVAGLDGLIYGTDSLGQTGVLSLETREVHTRDHHGRSSSEKIEIVNEAALLNERGEEGWELVDAGRSATGSYRYIFKRAKQ